ncbi:BRCA1-associated RING domain protein 1 [Galendromus occidentalis]|uniref:BRCA1-associated RING domain protein 1 n=1 Tax=Galendromus occidentalis TaxID=34638 RepID=A0AAJ6QS96_9ACAR|nr:BRCA1-associated RING domain protein 1 [Galendromus occidentalis]
MSPSIIEKYNEIVCSLRSNLECPSCRLHYRNPKISVRCTHAACYECFINLVCPVCQTPTSEADLKDEKRLQQLILIFKSLQVKAAPKSNAENVPQTATTNARSSSANIDLQPAFPTTPQQSARNARASAAQASIQKIDKKNRHGETPLHVACKKTGNIDRVRELLAQGANPNTQDYAGWSPLHEVAQSGDSEIARALLMNGADVNIKASCLTSPLHDAVTTGFVDIIKLFLEYGADPLAVNSDGKTPMQLSSYNEVIENLLKTVKPKEENIRGATTDSTDRKRLVIMTSSLKEPQMEKLNEFLELMDAQLAAHYTPQVTHLVVNSDSKGDTQRTLKFLQCLASRKSIVSYQWVEQCLKTRTLVSELPFEVKGCRQFSNTDAPRRAREAADGEQVGLLSGFNVYFAPLDKPYVPTTDNLIQLTELAGGNILKKHPKTSVGDDSSDSSASSPHVKPTSIFKKHKSLVVGLDSKISANVLYLTRDWLIDSISNFELIEPHL